MLEAGYSERKGGSEGKKKKEGGSFDGDGAEQLTRRFDDFAVSVFFYPLSLSLPLSSVSLCGQSRRLVAEDMKTML